MRMKISEIKINLAISIMPPETQSLQNLLAAFPWGHIHNSKMGRRDTQQRNVEELARSIAAVGLMNPITVTQDNTLIAGLHRLEAIQKSFRKIDVSAFSFPLLVLSLTGQTFSGLAEIFNGLDEALPPEVGQGETGQTGEVPAGA